MALNNSWESTFNLLGKPIPNNMDELVIHAIRDDLEKERMLAAHSTLFFYLVAKLEQNDIYSAIKEEWCNFNQYLVKLKNDCLTLYELLGNIDQLSEGDLSRITHLKKVIQIGNKIEEMINLYEDLNLHKLQSANENEMSKLFYRLPLFQNYFSQIVEIKEQLQLAKIEASSFQKHMDQILEKFITINEFFEALIDRAMSEEVPLDHIEQFVTFASVLKMATEKMKQLNQVDRFHLQLVNRKERNILLSINFNHMNLTNIPLVKEESDRKLSYKYIF